MAWRGSVATEDLFLSVLVHGEVRFGIELLRRRQDARQARSLENWLEKLKTEFEARTLPVTAAVAEAWGRLRAQTPLPPANGLLAATALVHGLILVTREAESLGRTGIPVLDPWRY